MTDVSDKYTEHKKITRLYYVLRRVGFEIMCFRLTEVHDNLTQISDANILSNFAFALIKLNFPPNLLGNFDSRL